MMSSEIVQHPAASSGASGGPEPGTQGPEKEGLGGTQGFSAFAFDVETSPDIGGPGEDIRQKFEAAVSTATEAARARLEKELREAEGLAGATLQGGGGGAIAAGFGAIARHRSHVRLQRVQQRLAMFESASLRTTKAASRYIEMLDRYNVSVGDLEAASRGDPRRAAFEAEVAATASSAGQTEGWVRARVHDPYDTAPEIDSLRQKAAGLAANPEYAQHLDEAGASATRARQAMAEMAAGIRDMGHTAKTDVSGFADVAAVAEDLSAGIQATPFSRPGDVAMDGDGAEMKQRLEEFVKQVRAIVDAVLRLFGGAGLAPDGPGVGA